MKKEPERKLSKEQLFNKLKRSVSLLLDDCLEFDNGKLEKIDPITSVLRNLLVKPRNNRGAALLEQLSMLDGKWFDFAMPINAIQPNNPTCNLIEYVVNDKGANAEPRLTWFPKNTKRTKNFKNWWEDPVAHNANLRTYSREDLIRNIGNTETSHVDGSLPESHWAFIEGNFVNILSTKDGEENKSFENLHHASIRTIAHETLLSIQSICPMIFKDGYVYQEEIFKPKGKFELKLLGVELSEGEKPTLQNDVDWDLHASSESNLDKRKIIYLDAIKIFPSSLRLITNFAVFLTKYLKEDDQAESLFKKALELDSSNVGHVINYAVFLFLRRKNYEESEKYFKQAILLEPKNAGVYIKYAWFLCNCRYDRKSANKYFKMAKLNDPLNINVDIHYFNFLLLKSRGLYIQEQFKLKKIQQILLTMYPDY